MFIHARHKHLVKNGIFTKIFTLMYVTSKTIHSLPKYIIMDYFDQEAKKSRCSISLTKGIYGKSS